MKASIEKEISLKILGSNIANWRIGLTHDLRDRYTHWRHTKSLSIEDWFAWEANSLSDAEAIEKQFIQKGMQGGTGGNLSSGKTVHVYVFA